ncbi:MAG: T9SS type A sorting domain-containing protein [Bacteroidota bacterium]
MKTIKSFILSTLMLTFISTQFSFAQGHRGHRGDKGEHLEQLKTTLNLSDEQVAEIKALEEGFRTQVRAIRSDENLESSAKREKLQALKTAQQSAIDGILTPGQIAKRDALKAEKKAEMQAQRAELKAKFEAIDKDAMKAELKAYRDENVQPVMLAQRQKLEESISLADKAEIEQLRTIFQAEKEKRKALKAELKAKKAAASESGEKPTEAERAAMHAQIKAQKEAMAPHRDAVKALIEKYDERISALLEEVKPQAETWKAATRTIKTKYFGDLMEEKAALSRKGNQHRKGHGMGKPGHGHHEKAGKGERGAFKKARFLLMNVEGETATNETTLPQINNLNVFPNPSTSRNTVQFEVVKAGTILIEIHDQSGNVVQRVAQKYLEPGIYREEVNVSQLKESVYYYVISDQSGMISEKFIKLP